jgi:hypothetical protein
MLPRLQLCAQAATPCCPGELAFVATQTDLLTPSELIENLRLPEGATARTCGLARNAFTKASVSKDFYADTPPEHLPCNRPLPAAWHARGFELPVFTVSARDFQVSSGIRSGDGGAHVFPEATETEVPALRAYLQLAAAAHARRAAEGGARQPVGALLLKCLEEAAKRGQQGGGAAAGAAGAAAAGATASGAGPSGSGPSTAEHDRKAATGAAASVMQDANIGGGGFKPRANSSYMIFCKAERPKIVEANPWWQGTRGGEVS